MLWKRLFREPGGHSAPADEAEISLAPRVFVPDQGKYVTATRKRYVPTSEQAILDAARSIT